MLLYGLQSSSPNPARTRYLIWIFQSFFSLLIATSFNVNLNKLSPAYVNGRAATKVLIKLALNSVGPDREGFGHTVRNVSSYSS